MYNPFKNTYKIIELSRLSGSTSFEVDYGNIFFSSTLHEDGFVRDYSSHEFSSLEEIKNAIRLHQETLLSDRLKKITTKVIARI